MKMHNNTIWLAFLVLCVLVVLWFSGTALYKLYYYSFLQSETMTTSAQWSVNEISDEKFVLEAKYTYLVNGKEYSGSTSFPEDYHLNAWSAEQTIKKLSITPSKVWYSSSRPHISSLEKKFPYRQVISATLLWALLLYFIWLGFYVVK